MSTLVCPNCHSGESLFSDEEASILYPVVFTEDGMEYTGESYEVIDEGTMSRDTFVCRGCGTVDLGELDLVPAGTTDDEGVG